MKLKQILFFSLLINFLLIGGIIYSIVRTDYSLNLKPVDVEVNTTDLDLKSLISGVTFENLPQTLYRANYMHTRNVEKINLFEKDLQLLDSLYPGREMDIRSMVSLLLTDSLKARMTDSMTVYNPQYLVQLQNWYIGFYYQSKNTPNSNNALLYSVLSDYWGTYVANSLSAFSRIDSKLKFDYSFKFLTSRNEQYKYLVNPKTSSLEKVIHNIIEQDWAHLFEASWSQSSVLQKCLFAIIFLITLVSYACLISVLKIKLFPVKK